MLSLKNNFTSLHAPLLILLGLSAFAQDRHANGEFKGFARPAVEIINWHRDPALAVRSVRRWGRARTVGNHVSLNRANYAVFPDKPLVFIHESFHSDLVPAGGFLDVALAAAAGRPINPGLTGDAAINQGSLNFQGALNENCGKP